MRVRPPGGRAVDEPPGVRGDGPGRAAPPRPRPRRRGDARRLAALDGSRGAGLRARGDPRPGPRPPRRRGERAPVMTGSPLRAPDRAWFRRDSLELARDLLGAVLVRSTPEGTVAIRITEVEAYRGAEDPASHVYRGPTARNAA